MIPSDIALMARHGEVLHYTYDVHVCERVCEKASSERQKRP